MTKYGYIAITALSLVLLSCGPQKGVCENPGKTRCKKSFVELCSPAGRWTVISDCSVVEPGDWICQKTEGDHACLKAPPDVPDAPQPSESTSTSSPSDGDSGVGPNAPTSP